MNRLAVVLSLIFISGALCAQELPKLKPFSEKEMKEDLVPVQRRDKWGYANEKEHFRVKPVFDMADSFARTVVSGKDTVTSARVRFEGKYGFLNRTGIFLYEPVFDSLSEFDRGVSVFTKGGVSGFLNASGKVLADGLEEMQLFDENGVAWFRKDGKWGMYDLDGNVVVSNEYDKVSDVSFGELHQVEKNGKYGLVVYSQKKVVLDAECDQIAYDEKDKNVVICRKGDLYGCFNIDGRQLLPVEYESVTGYEDGRIVVKKDGRYGLYDNKGTMLVAAVMHTDQVAEAHPYYQVFDTTNGREEVKVYYKDQLLDIKAFDEQLFADLGKDVYSDVEKDTLGRFPRWMKGHFYDAVHASQVKAQWRFDKTAYYPQPGDVRPAGAGSYITIDKDMKVLDHKGFELSATKDLNEAVLKVDSLAVSCGSWIRTLMISHMCDCKTLSVEIRNAILAPDGEPVIVADVVIDRQLKQRAAAKFSPSGIQRFTVRFDGILANQVDYVADEESGCFATEDMVILSFLNGKNKDKVTRFYTYSGHMLTQVDHFCAEALIASSPEVKLFGKDSDSYGICAINFETRLLTRTILEQSTEDKIARIIDGTVHFVDENTMLTDAVFDLTSKHMPVLALRYDSAVWDGKTIVGVCPNYCAKSEDIRWTYIPRVLSGSYSENINGYMVNIYPVGGDDIAVYGIYPDVWSSEGMRYGYIGYDGKFFTQAYFEEAKPFTDGVAEVKIKGEWKKLSKEDFKPYMSNPDGKFSPENYEIGTVVFTMEHVAKSMSGAANEITEDGFWLTRGNGGELIAYLNTFTGKYGFADSAGEMVTAPVYDSFHNIDPSEDGLIAVRRDDGTGDANSGWGFIDMRGNQVVPCEYYAQWSEDAASLFSAGENGVCILSKILPDGQKKIGCINKSGNIVIPFEYDEITGPVNNLLTAKVGDELKQFWLY